MLDLNDYFNPVSIEKHGFENLTGNAGFPHNIVINTENNRIKDFREFKVALLGVPDGRNSPNQGSSDAPDAIRQQLYSLARIPGKIKDHRSGKHETGDNIRRYPGRSYRYTLHASDKENIFPVIIGGSSALVTAIDRSFTLLKTRYTLVSVDPRIDYSNNPDAPDSFSYLNKITGNHKSTFSQYINIGYQTYLNDQQVLEPVCQTSFGTSEDRRCQTGNISYGASLQGF